ncbi:MAG: 1-hydroxycarotenoid 3,4-desaturase CrtD [Bacteroidota bacterium]
MSVKAIVIGSGVAGMATAARLQAKGYETTVFEANPYPGGKLTEIESRGYRFDAGPSLFTLPELLDDVFHVARKNPRNYYDYEKLDVACHYFYEDGTQLKSYTDAKKFGKEIEQVLGVNAQTVIDYLKKSKIIYEEVGLIFLNHSLHKASTWLTKDVVKALLKIYKYDIHKSMNQANEAGLSHPKLVQLFNRYATYNGSNPYKAPGILNSIPHLEHNIGTFFPKGGMHTITNALVKLNLDLGVEFKYESTVDEIVLDRKGVKGVKSNGGFTSADCVISNMDVYHTYDKLLPTYKVPRQIRKQERSSSALIYYWGIKKEFKELGLHNIFFSENYASEFDHLFNKKELYHDPTVYINITSKLNHTDAPAGSENWFVMVNAPCNEGQDWASIKVSTRKAIISKLSRILKTDIEPLIETQEVLEPLTIESKTSSYKGSLYGTSSNSKLAAFLRHPNFTSKIKGLYFCGGSVHPGGGIPLCLLSGKIVANLVYQISN